MIRKATVAALAAAGIAACSSTPATQRPAPSPLGFTAVADSVIQIGMRETQWGVEIWDQARNRPIYAHNNDRHFIPASNTKLVVTTVAMGLLGPDWRYETPVLAIGASGDSVARGLIIRGSGDPTMSARFFASNFAVVEAFADSLSQKGLRRIAGDVIVDASRFGTNNIHSAWEIGDLPWYYATRTTAFAIAEAETRMIVSRGGGATDSVRIRFDGDPLLPAIARVRMDTAGASPNIDIDYQAWPDSVVVTGSIGPNSADTSRIALPNPEFFAARALIDALKRKGIVVTGEALVERDSARAGALQGVPLFTWRSPPVSDVIGGILKPSQNWIAEQLLKTLGYAKGNGASWREGLRVERRYLIDVAGIDSTAFFLSDGSGLSAQNVVAPHAFVTLLEHVRRAPWAPQYRAALPVPGMRGGTLSSRLSGLESRLAAKTGTIANVNSLSGYVRSVDGRDITFSIMTNGSGRASSEVRRAIDVIVQAIAREQNWE